MVIWVLATCHFEHHDGLTHCGHPCGAVGESIRGISGPAVGQVQGGGFIWGELFTEFERPCLGNPEVTVAVQ